MRIHSVKGAEKIPSPCCGQHMKVIGTRYRKCKERSGETKIYNFRRLSCTNCGRIHHEIPDFLMPYKRYEMECIEVIISDVPQNDVPADNSTLFRWKNWFIELVDYWIGCLHSISFRNNKGVPMELTSVAPLSALQRLGRLVGNAPRWMVRFVRPIVNDNLWVHTRSAFLSKGY
ncbi:DUF6431 domain-containing protein [Bacillaceae bacterium S4-13-58]